MNNTKYVWIIGVLFALVLIGIFVNDKPSEIVIGDGINYFESKEEMRKFLEENVDSGYGYYRGFGGVEESFAVAESGAADASVSSAAPGKSSASEYSETNIQVEGVDEPDIVKNDGKYIYSVSGNKVVIVDAYPAEEMKLLSEISFEDGVSNIFLNGDKLVVFSQRNEYIDSGIRCGDVFDFGFRCGGYSKQESIIYIYDVSDRMNPILEDELKVDGYYNDARMIDKNVYLVSTKYIDSNFFESPGYSLNGNREEVSFDQIGYFESYDSNYVFTMITALNIENGDSNTEAYLLGSANRMYFSQNNIYITYSKQISSKKYFEKYVEEVILPVLPSSLRDDVNDIVESDESTGVKNQKIRELIGDYPETLSDDEKILFFKDLEKKSEAYFEDLAKQREMTLVHKIGIDEMKIEYKASGEFPGHVNNQFSMDEYEGNFRVTTTSTDWDNRESINNLFVLNEDLKIVGSVEGLAPGERIYSTRFMGGRAYMVTFRQVDPLYVIDVNNPENPEVLGFLKITGYSSYLHPYDENHLIGVGMEATEQGRATGVKISLFDVTNVEKPVEKGKYEIKEGEWSQSQALYDHKAFLFDREREILVIPVSYTEKTNGQYRYSHWQGAYVLNIDLAGIGFRGKISHSDKGSDDQYYWGGDDYVRRSLYMDDVLYTISNAKIKASEIQTLDLISETEWEYEQYYGHYGRGAIDEPVAVDSVILE